MSSHLSRLKLRMLVSGPFFVLYPPTTFTSTSMPPSCNIKEQSFQYEIDQFSLSRKTSLEIELQYRLLTSAVARSASVLASLSTVTSALRVKTVAPVCSRILAAKPSRRSALMSLRTSDAPSSAKRSAIAPPEPASHTVSQHGVGGPAC